MPARRSKSSSGLDVSSTRSVPYDLTRPENKMVSQLKDELDSKGTDYPRYARKSQLITLCKRSGDLPVQWSKHKVTVSPITDDEDASVMPRSRPDNAERCIHDLRHGSQNATLASTSTTTNAHDVNKDGNLQKALLLSLTETVKSLSDKVNAMQTPVNIRIDRHDRCYCEDQTAKGTEYTLASLPFVETVSPAIRRQVIEGKDVNLAVLLIPYYTGPMSNDEKIDTYYCSNQKPDPRLNKCLNIIEFIQAFGTYKNIMCEAFPNRRH